MLQAWRGGDPAALEELLLMVEPRLVSLCFRMCGRPQDARDLCQEAMVKIIQGLPGFTGRSRVSTWMIRVTMNVCLTDRRRGKIRRTTSLDAPCGQGTAGEDRTLGDSRTSDGEPTPAERVERGEDLGRLSRGLARMEPEQRALLILRDAQGLDYAEIADVMEIPVGTVKSRLFRARVALREEVEKG
ncbi:MAG: RNA polymerase sigma factor [Phycisphaerae bacterium]|nr:RNA polymerase sigma factor [Phycisphaerae bacterium]